MFGVEWLKRVLTTKPRERTRYVTESWLRVVLVLYWSVVTVVNSQSVYYALQTHPDVWVVGSVEKFRSAHLLRDSVGREKDAVIEVEFVYKGKTYRVNEKGYNFNRSIYVQARDTGWVRVYVVPEKPERSMMSTGVPQRYWTYFVIMWLLEVLLIGYAVHIFYQLYRKDTPWPRV